MTRLILADEPVPDRQRGCRVLSRPGMTVAEIVAEALPDTPEAALDRVRVTIAQGSDVAVVPRRAWSFVRPKPGAVVIVTRVPGAASIASFLAVNFINVTGITSVAAAYAVGYAAIGITYAGLAGIAGALASSLVPGVPDRRTPPSPEEGYQLDGWRNQVDPGVAIPYPVGRIRMAPLFAARPYSEVINEEQYLVGLFCWGHGRLDISDVQIGETPVSELTDIEIETREGTDADAAITLVREQVIEDRLGVELQPQQVGGDENWQTWTTPRECDRVRLVFNWPGGTFFVQGDGKGAPVPITVGVQVRAVGSGTWTTILSDAEPWFTGWTTKGFFKQLEWSLPARGQYEVRVHFGNPPPSETVSQRTILLTAAGIREQEPIAYDGNLALTAVRVRASEMANGTLDAVNGVVQRYAPTWDGSTWTDALTRNPASAALSVLQAQAGAYPVEEGLLHLGDWAAFHDFCADKGLKFDRVISGDETLGEALAAICAAGRATWHRDGQGWGVVIDRPQDLIVDQLSPRNATQIRWARNYVERPDAFRCVFRDETNGWEEAERIVPWPGNTAPPVVLEDVQLPGKTDPGEVWTELRRRQYEIDLRPDTFTAVQQGVVRVATRGDAVRLSCDILDEVQASAQVRAVDGRRVILDTPVEMVAGETYGLRWQVYDDADPIGDMAEAALVTVAGDSTAVTLVPGAEVPPVGVLVHFGKTGQIDFLCRVTRVEPAQGGAYRLTLVNDAAEIDTLTDAEVPPAWVREQGSDTATGGTPATPLIGTITSEAATYDYSGTPSMSIRVPVSVPASNQVPVARLDLSHRLNGAPGYDTTELIATSGEVVIVYPLGSDIEVYATAVSVYGDASDDSATVEYTATGDVTLATALDPAGVGAVAGLGHATITVATQADTAELQLFRAPGGTPLDTDAHAVGGPVGVAGSSTAAIVDGDQTRADLMDAGDMTDASAWTVPVGWSVGGGVATHTAGSTGALSQALSLDDGTVVRARLTISARTAGSVSLRLAGTTPADSAAVSSVGAHLLTLAAVSDVTAVEIVPTSDFDGSVSELVLYAQTAGCAPQGAHDYYVAPINGDGIANVPSGPLAVTII